LLVPTTGRSFQPSAMDMVSQVLNKSGKSFSRAGKMTDSLLSTKKTTSKSQNTKQQQKKKEDLTSTSVDGSEKEDKAILDEKIKNFYTTKTISTILTKNEGVVNTVQPATEWKQQQQVPEATVNNDHDKTFDIASEDEEEKAARKKSTKKKKSTNKSSHFFRSLARDDVKVNNFISSNNGFLCDNPPVGHYRPKHTIIEKTLITPNINWGRQVVKTARRVPNESDHEHQETEEGHEITEEERAYLAQLRSQTAPSSLGYTKREFNMITSSFDPRSGPTSMFKSKTKLREMKPLNLDLVYDTDNTKGKFPTTGHHIAMETMLGRDQHAQSMSARTGGGGFSVGYDMVYQSVDVEVTQRRMAKGVMELDKQAIGRAKHRRGGRMNLEQLNDDVENRENVRYPNWSTLYDKNSTPAHLLSSRTSRSEPPNGIGQHEFGKHLGRSDTLAYQQLMYTPAHANILMNTTDLVINKHANAARGAVSANQAYSKTHRNIPFLVNMDKAKGRDEFLQAPPDHIHLDYDVDMDLVKARKRVMKIHQKTKAKKPNGVAARTESPKAQFYDKNHQLSESRGLDFDFSKAPDRDRHKSAFVQRSKVTLLDKFYDTGAAKEKFCNQRLNGDPQIKHQLGRDETAFKKKKKYLGQDKFYLGHQWPGGSDDIHLNQHNNNNANQNKTEQKHLIDGKAYVEFSRKNELDRYEKFSSAQSHNPPVGAYDPKFDLTQPRPVAVPFSKAPARSS
jgi:hypothetical protein